MARNSHHEDTDEKLEFKMAYDSNFKVRFPKNYDNKTVTSFLKEDNSFYNCNETKMMNSKNADDYRDELLNFSFFKQSIFTHIQHTTTLDAAKKILNEGMLPKLPNDDSVCGNSKSGQIARNLLGAESQSFQSFKDHPAQSCEITWWGPYLPKHDQDAGNKVGICHGNVTFLLPMEFMMTFIREKGYNMYYVENLEYTTIVASRFLITWRKDLKLKRYDPLNPEKGPWSIMQLNNDDIVGKTEQYQPFTGQFEDGSYLMARRLDLEFMIELRKGDDSSDFRKQWIIVPTWPSKDRWIRNKFENARKMWLPQNHYAWLSSQPEKSYFILMLFLFKMAHPEIKLFLFEHDVRELVEGLQTRSRHFSNDGKRQKVDQSFRWIEISKLSQLAQAILSGDNQKELLWGANEFDLFQDVALKVLKIFSPKEIETLVEEKISNPF